MTDASQGFLPRNRLNATLADVIQSLSRLGSPHRLKICVIHRVETLGEPFSEYRAVLVWKRKHLDELIERHAFHAAG